MCARFQSVGSNDGQIRMNLTSGTLQFSSRPPETAGRPSAIRVGDRVRARRQVWNVAGVRAYAACDVVTLAGAGPMNAGVERLLVVPFDIIEPIDRPGRAPIAHMNRWRRGCRTLIACDGPAGILRAAASASIELLPHQLEPALAIVRGSASRVLIADEVGLGKTIEAGLVLSELRVRGAADRILIL